MASLNIFHKSAKSTLCYDCDKFFCDIIYISHAPKRKNWNYSQQGLHRHPNYELHLILDGYSEFELKNNSSLKVGKNQFVIFPPEYKHRIISESPDFSKLSCLFAFSAKESEFYKKAEIAFKEPLIVSADDKLIKLTKNILEIDSNKINVDYYNTLLFAFMSFFIEMTKQTVGNKIFEIKKNIADKRVEEAIAFINNNISANLTVNDVSNEIHISKKHLERIFMNHCFMTPGNYIKNRKAKAIRDLLLNLDLSLDDIAEELGYNDISSMIKFFKRVEGITPYKYRKFIYRTF